MLLRRRSIKRQAEKLTLLAAELRWFEAALDLALRRTEAEDLDDHDAKLFLEGLGLPAQRTGNLALLSHQKPITDAMSSQEICDLQAQQLSTLAAELMWYDTAVRLALTGQAVREASHHDAGELLEVMGL